MTRSEIKCPHCGKTVAVFLAYEDEIPKEKPHKPRPWAVGDWAKLKPESETPTDLVASQSLALRDIGSYQRKIAGIDGETFSLDGCYLELYHKDRFIRTDEHGNPDPEQPEE